MKIYTIAFLFRDGKMLLGKKRRGFGIGKWNGYGGKLEEGETIIDCAVREVEEESTLVLPKDAFKELGLVHFYFDDKPEWNQEVVIYRVDYFEGEPIETEEMSPEWFALDKLPYDAMWVGDDKWLPFVLEGKKFKGEIHFRDEGKTLVSHVLE